MRLLYIFTITLLITTPAVMAQTILTLQLDSLHGADATIITSPFSNEADVQNFGEEEHIAAFSWKEDEEDEWHTRTLLNFDWSAIPQGAHIVNARLNLYSDPELSDLKELSSDDFQTNELFLKRIVKPWNEMEVTWATQPETSDENMKLVESDYSNISDLLGIDVTNIVKDIIQNPNSSHGIMMQLVQENKKRARILASSENPAQELAPKLEITYTKDTNSGGSMIIGETKIKYWPNPVVTNLNIMAATDASNNQHVRIFDLLGNLKYEGDFTFLQSLSINTSDWTEGVYLMQVSADELKKSVRIYKR